MKYLTISLCVAGLLLSGCAGHKLGQKLRGFVKAEITVPGDLECVSDRNITKCGIASDTPALIMYYDSTECSGCKINRLSDLIPVYELSDSLGTFEVMTLFSPRQEEYDEVVRQLMFLDFPYPVYVDYSGEFRKSNACIPDDKRFHSFLVGRDGHPAFVGNPVASDELWDLFVETLSARL